MSLSERELRSSGIVEIETNILDVGESLDAVAGDVVGISLCFGLASQQSAPNFQGIQTGVAGPIIKNASALFSAPPLLLLQILLCSATFLHLITYCQLRLGLDPSIWRVGFAPHICLSLLVYLLACLHIRNRKTALFTSTPSASYLTNNHTKPLLYSSQSRIKPSWTHKLTLWAIARQTHTSSLPLLLPQPKTPTSQTLLNTRWTTIDRSSKRNSRVDQISMFHRNQESRIGQRGGKS